MTLIMALAGCKKNNDGPTGNSTGDPNNGAEPTTFTVTFDSNGGSAVEPKTVNEGETVSTPEAPTKTDHAFAGWFTDNGTFADAVVFPLTVAADITLYAKWTSVYTVTFDSNGGSAVGPQTVNDGETVSAPTAPTRTNYLLVGWYTDNGTFADMWDFASRTVTAATTLYAKWEYVGVLINGVRWAECNVDALGTFAANPEDAGMFYQWNRSTAWPTTGDITSWDTTPPGGESWEPANDPCPAGWRVPITEEYAALLETAKVTNAWTTLNSVNGRMFTDNTSGASIFLPAAGGRNYIDGVLGNAGDGGLYWSSSPYTYPYVWYLYLNDSNTGQNGEERRRGFSVRCVRQ